MNPLEPGQTVVHPQWGRGTVLFDKPHCIGIRFIEYGHVNFTQEEWAAQHSSPERFRSVSNLEYKLQRLVDSGELSEQKALELTRQSVHPLELNRYKSADVNAAYIAYQASPKNNDTEEQFYKALLAYITAAVKRQAFDGGTFSNIEDAIQESVIEVWNKLESFNPAHSSFKSWVTMLTIRNVRDAVRQFRTQRGNRQKPNNCPTCGAKGKFSSEAPTDTLFCTTCNKPFSTYSINRTVALDDSTMSSKTLNIEGQLLFKEWRKLVLHPVDREIVQMLSDGLTQEEIAAALRISQPAVSKRLSRLRKVIKSPF